MRYKAAKMGYSLNHLALSANVIRSTDGKRRKLTAGTILFFVTLFYEKYTELSWHRYCCCIWDGRGNISHTRYVIGAIFYVHVSTFILRSFRVLYLICTSHHVGCGDFIHHYPWHRCAVARTSWTCTQLHLTPRPSLVIWMITGMSSLSQLRVYELRPLTFTILGSDVEDTPA